MSTPDERVEVTPELIASLEAKASAATQGPWACWNGWRGDDGSMFALHVGPVGTEGGLWGSGGADVRGSREDLEHVASACPSVVLALVQRIRELESAEQPMEMALCEQDNVTLRPGQPYVFRVLPGCEKCASLAAVYGS